MNATSTLPDQILSLENLLFSDILHIALPNGKLLVIAAVDFLSKNLNTLKLLGIIVTALFLIGTLYLAIIDNSLGSKLEKITGSLGKSGKNKKKSNKAWLKIKKHLSYNDESHSKLAVIEADNLLDDVLKSANVRGETLGERLKNLNPAQLPNLNEIWEAHKIRNRLVHEPDYPLDSQTALKVISFYEKAFKGLELID
jgi:hypothetical protein